MSNKDFDLISILNEEASKLESVNKFDNALKGMTLDFIIESEAKNAKSDKDNVIKISKLREILGDIDLKKFDMMIEHLKSAGVEIVDGWSDTEKEKLHKWRSIAGLFQEETK